MRRSIAYFGLAISLTLGFFALSPAASAQTKPYKSRVPDFMMRSNEEARFQILGFPMDYEQTSLCGAFDNVGPFRTIYLAKNIEPDVRALLTQQLTASGVVEIIENANKADYLVEMDTRYLMQLTLWAVSRRPNAKLYGQRCDVMGGADVKLQPVVGKMIGFLWAMQSSDRGPRHFSSSGRYISKYACYKYIPDAEILAFKRVYLERDTPPALAAQIAAELKAAGRYTVVANSQDADYMVSLSRREQTDVQRTQRPDIIDGGPISMDPSDGSIQQGEGTRRSGGYDQKKVRFDIAELTIRGVKHPPKPGAPGLVCDIYYKQADKIKGLSGLTRKDPGKKLTEELLRFFAAPDLTYSQYPKQVLEVFYSNGQ
jgi:hypothetical protein